MGKKFWEEGIRFQCQGTGKCCVSHTSFGHVYLTLKDRQRLARHLNMTTSEFTRARCVKTDGYFHLREVTGPCSFLKGKQCGVYEARPDQCRTWPFWPENMNARVWTKEIATFCPGVGKGRLYSKDEIEALLKQDPIVASS